MVGEQVAKGLRASEAVPVRWSRKRTRRRITAAAPPSGRPTTTARPARRRCPQPGGCRASIESGSMRELAAGGPERSRSPPWRGRTSSSGRGRRARAVARPAGKSGGPVERDGAAGVGADLRVGDDPVAAGSAASSCGRSKYTAAAGGRERGRNRASSRSAPSRKGRVERVLLDRRPPGRACRPRRRGGGPGARGSGRASRCRGPARARRAGTIRAPRRARRRRRRARHEEPLASEPAAGLGDDLRRSRSCSSGRSPPGSPPRAARSRSASCAVTVQRRGDREQGEAEREAQELGLVREPVDGVDDDEGDARSRDAEPRSASTRQLGPAARARRRDDPLRAARPSEAPRRERARTQPRSCAASLTLIARLSLSPMQDAERRRRPRRHDEPGHERPRARARGVRAPKPPCRPAAWRSRRRRRVESSSRSGDRRSARTAASRTGRCERPRRPDVGASGAAVGRAPVT